MPPRRRPRPAPALPAAPGPRGRWTEDSRLEMSSFPLSATRSATRVSPLSPPPAGTPPLHLPTSADWSVEG